MTETPPARPNLEYVSRAEQTAQQRVASADTGNEPPPVTNRHANQVSYLVNSLQEMARALNLRFIEMQRLQDITARINAGLLLDEILEGVYQDFRVFIPYNRIGFALIEDDGQQVRARWAKSDRPTVQLAQGYHAALVGSSLETIIKTGKSRIINDLEAYLAAKPDSESTRLIVQEGIRSSLTCPLIANGVPVGFMFFSSAERNTYASSHVEIFERIAGQLAVIVEKGRLVSELAEQKAEIERQNEQLRHLNEVKNAFLGMAAHDLRHPLSTVQMTCDLLSDPVIALSEDERREMLHDIGQQTRYMLALLDDLLDVSQIESGELSLNRTPVSLEDCFSAVIPRHSRVAESKNTRIVLEPLPPGKVMADPLRLQQVLDNLISNAVKYSPPGSMIRIRTVRVGDWWEIAVQDQGPGITPEDRQRLFQNFARLSAQPTGNEKSTGLGLAITRRVVEAHGGQIGVDSEPGLGATFWFRLSASPH